MDAAVDVHPAKVARVAAALRAHAGGRPVSFKKRAVAHQVPKRDDRTRDDAKIDLSDLDAILAIDPEAMTCTAEPGVTFTDLLEATAPYGLCPIIVPELRTITVGGAVTGCSLESASFEHGGFHDTCLEYEVVTARGDVVTCRPDGDEALLFQMIHGSFGTLGVLTKLVFRLRRAKPYVHLAHVHRHALADYTAEILRHVHDRDVDFMDGFAFAPDDYVLSLGRFVDHAPYTNRYDWMKVYYRSTARRQEDYLRTADYFFRYDNGVTNVNPHSAIGRLVLGKFLHSSELLRAAERLHGFLPKERPNVTVDLFLPVSRLDAFLGWYDRAIGHYPLWCVPYKRVRDYEWIASEFFRGMRDELFVDLAIYGLAQPAGHNYYKEIEEELLRVGGIKTLISYNYYDEETFWRIFDRPRYMAVKARTDPDNLLRDLYSKTCRAPRGLDDVPVAIDRTNATHAAH